MYQKRKVRQEKTNNQDDNNKLNINWVMVSYKNFPKSVEISKFVFI